jgi:ATP-binding cassette, subfamily B, bacterial
VTPEVSPLRHLAALLRGRGALLGLVTLLALGVTGATLALPLVVRSAIDDGLAAGDREAFHLWVAVAAGVLLLRAVLAASRTLATGHLAEGVVARAREAAMEGLARRPVTEVERRPADVLAALTADVDALLRAAGTAAPALVEAVALLLVAAVVLTALSPPLALITVLALPLVAIAGHRFVRRSPALYARIREHTAEVVGRVAENAHAAETLRGLAAHGAAGRPRAGPGAPDGRGVRGHALPERVLPGRGARGGGRHGRRGGRRRLAGG